MVNDRKFLQRTIELAKESIKQGGFPAGAVVYASLQSCLMCFSAANWANISKIVYACRKTPEMVSKNYYEGKTENEKINLENNRQIELVFIPDFQKESLDVIDEWEKKFKLV